MKKLFVLLSAFFYTFFLAAQPVDFSVNTNSICTPDDLVCTDLTQGITIVAWTWTFDGNIVSPDQNPTILIDNYTPGMSYDLCLTVVDDLGFDYQNCQSIQVEAKPVVTVSVSSLLDCANPFVDVICFPQNTGTYSYSWTGPGGNYTTQNITVSVPGIYTVVVTDALTGCTHEEDVSVLSDMTPVHTVTVGPDTLWDCSNGTDLTLFADVTPAGNYSFQWSTSFGNIVSGANTSTPTISQTGEYSVEVVNLDNGCTTTTVMMINGTDVPVNDISPDFTICEGESATLFYDVPSAVSYFWPATGETTNTITVFPSTTTDYLVIAMDANGCSTQDIIIVNVSPTPISSVFVPSISCPTDFIEICGIDQANYSYQWIRPTGLISNTRCLDLLNSAPTDNGVYTLTVTDPFGCTSATDYTHVAMDSFAVDFTIENTSCFGGTDGSVQIMVSGGTPPYNYNWGSGITCQGTQCTGLAADTYFVTITDQNACQIMYSFEILEPSQVEIVNVAVSCVGDDGTDGSIDITVQGGTAPYAFLWNNAQVTEDLTNIAAGGYMVTVTDVNNCVTSEAFVVMENCVWPGDTDTNNVVNNFDLLNLGLVYGETGPTRFDASLSWFGQAGANWLQTIPSTDIDTKHADTDGNGIIDINDTLAISLNWGETHNLMGNTASPRNDLDLYVQEDTTSQGETMSLPIILGEMDNPAVDIYGIAFSVTYDTSIVSFGSSDISFTNSWLGTKGLDLITIQKDFPVSGRVDLAISRTNGMNISGSGEIGRLNIIIEDDILLMSDQAETRGGEDLVEMSVKIDRVKLINNLGEVLGVNPLTTTSVITKLPLSNAIIPSLDTKIELYPNPSRDFLTIQSDELVVETVEIFSILGKLLRRQTVNAKQTTLDLKGLGTGTYLVKLKTAKGTVVKRASIVR
ncbi:MAG: T9SS type A sorting domain-containing protein [Saprospiraceae bacterium]